MHLDKFHKFQYNKKNTIKMRVKYTKQSMLQLTKLNLHEINKLNFIN